MNVYQGKSVFGGIAIGHLCVYKKGEQQNTSKIAGRGNEVKRSGCKGSGTGTVRRTV